MIRAFLLSVRQLDDPVIARVFGKSFMVTLLVFALFGVGLWFGAQGVAHWLFGANQATSTLAAVAATLGAAAAVWLLFRAVAIAVVGLFADEVVRAVEVRHYPQAVEQSRDVAFSRSLAMGLGSAARTIGANILIAPIYVALLATGIGTAVLFVALNGWLLGRDLGDMVAARHLPHAAMRGWRRTTRWRRLALGLAVTGLLMVPLINLIAPVLGAAMSTHLFHRKTRI